MQTRSILIADAGSTKTAWALLRPDAETLCFSTIGINALTAGEEEFLRLGDELKAKLPAEVSVESIYYYGAGCAIPTVCVNMASHLGAICSTDRVAVESDLLGAARGLCGHEAGIACILGTGSNSCCFDGSVITAHTPSLGFILGDEGGGVSLGRRLLSDAFKGVMPSDLRQMLIAETGLNEAGVLENVYRRGAPNRFLASFVPFIARNIKCGYLEEMVRDEFRRFITRNIASYPDAENIPVSFTGGVAATFADLLKETIEECGMTLGRISRQPLEGLVSYHSIHAE